MGDPKRLKHRSWEVTEGPARAPARAMMRGMGLSDEDLARPLVGVSNTWNEATPCQLNLDRVARRVKAAVREGGGTPREFMTITVSDAIAMGHEGMRASLVSREVIADSIELMMHAHRYDALVACAACDKSIPGSIMAMARLNVPSIFTYGGPMLPGRFEGRDVTIQDVFEAVGAFAAGTMSAARLDELERSACPGAGTCAGLFTANTMASCAETFGRVLGAGRLPPDALPVRGGSWAQRLLIAPAEISSDIVRPIADPISPAGTVAVLRGNLAPEGAVVKTAMVKHLVHRGLARVFE